MIAAERFDEFFVALYGYTPFPWQRRLAQRAAQADWPRLIDLPTASGKTSVLDAWAFALACQAERPPAERTAPRRIAFVVDRRVIVDEAFERAAKLRDKLQDAQDGVLKEVADALRRLAGSAAPLQCFQLRGGMYRDDDWARTPIQPTILTSTVDQIGSRLLFRSYGFVKQYMYPIHAGLAAYDMLIVLDEAHCAQSFEQTARAVERYRGWAQAELPGPFRFVTMTATPRPGEISFGLDDEDRAHKTLNERMSASKPATLLVVDDVSAALAAQAEALAQNGLNAIGVMVNRVATARQVYDVLKEKHSGDVLLLIGRMRPFDRDRVQKSVLFKQLLADRSQTRQLDRPEFVVATQTLEVGANLDFDGLVTECASLDALRQRFGRLNRMGRDIAARGVIVIKTADAKDSSEDAVYGAAQAETWKWLNQVAASGNKSKERRGKKAAASAAAKVVDMGINALAPALAELAKLSDEERNALAQNPTYAPVMLPAHVDAWAQTAPAPVPEPDVSIFLHGPERSIPEVKLIWRCDLDDSSNDVETWVKAISLCPPTSVEALAAPLYLVKQWLSDLPTEAPDLSDLEGVVTPREGNNNTSIRQVLLWRGPEESVLTSDPAELLPGDAVIVPVAYGGWERFGHVLDDALDIAEPALFQSKREAVLRLHPETLKHLPACEGKLALMEMADMEDAPDLRDLRRALAEIAAIAPDYLQPLLAAFIQATKLTVEAHPIAGWVVRARLPRRPQGTDDPVPPFTNEDDSASLIDRIDDGRVTLMQHTSGVARTAGNLAERCGLPPAMVGDFELAGTLHDIGKADPRFQKWLYGCMGRRYSPTQPLIAKSTPLNESQKWRARAESGYPKGARHELLSLSLIQHDEVFKAQAHDWDLVLHLIASHHGRCRPFAPVVVDTDPAEVDTTLFGSAIRGSTATGLERLDSGIVERFWTLTRKYGWWGLAYLESIFRLADHHQSAIDTGR
ncbi:MAG: type I-U CRISPR-associated helicase/endonuclease Cas3 [Chloroflexi bacterium]|nr:type I-U CRISPR-associated helicase/endonuclease Cas3 [Chloroflexota bacterium]